ncbi:hypothetical protein KEM52_000347 [Ascosphaera acerosa]|nr:hypothetical protein KEM52_000347 [Ascosphaera acerosa]
MEERGAGSSSRAAHGQQDYATHTAGLVPGTERPSTATGDDDVITMGGFADSAGLSRTDSVYSLSRSSLSYLLSRLTSMHLPEVTVLQEAVEGPAAAADAVQQLRKYSLQMQQWLDKVADVLTGLDADEDIEWAAAGGRQSLDEITTAVTKFQTLVEAYLEAIGRISYRRDYTVTEPAALEMLQAQRNGVLDKWELVKSQLRDVRTQVELAIQWEDLWKVVLGDVSTEIDEISKLIFELEEKRHQIMTMDSDPSHGVDLNELETIVEDTPSARLTTSHAQASRAPGLMALQGLPPLDTPTRSTADDMSLLELFARMQPLRASLDFLPMHLDTFLSRARAVFPTACQEVEDRRSYLERRYEKLQNDANVLKGELGEDRWVIVFRNAGAQANKMFDTIERSIGKLQDAISQGGMGINVTTIMTRIENFEAKRTHYKPAIQRVLGIIETGIKNRLTVNGEIIRLQTDLRARNEALERSITAMQQFYQFEGQSACANSGSHAALCEHLVSQHANQPQTSIGYPTPRESSCRRPHQLEATEPFPDSTVALTFVTSTNASRQPRQAALEQQLKHKRSANRA